MIHNTKLDRILQVNIRNISAKKKAEEELKKSEENFRKITENTTEMIHILLPDGTVEWVNQSWKKNLGYEDHEVIGKHISQFVTAESLESFKKDSLSLQSGESIELLRIFVAKSGEPIYAEGNSTILTENGKVSKIQAFLRNITSEVRAKKNLHINIKRLNEAQQIAKIGSWELNLVNNELTWSDEAYRIFDVNPEEFGASYEAFLDIIHPDDRDMVNEAYTNSLKTKQPYKITHRIRYKDGTITYVEEQCKTFFDIDGRPLKSIGTCQDITDKILAEQKIIASENRFNLAMQGANDGLWDWDLVHDKLYFSPRWKSMLGFADHELENTFSTWVDLLHPEDHEKSKQILDNYLFSDKEEYISEFRMRHKNGQYVDILSRGRGIKDMEGNVIRMVGTHIDITERKKHENFLSLINAGINVKTGASFFQNFKISS